MQTVSFKMFNKSLPPYFKFNKDVCEAVLEAEKNYRASLIKADTDLSMALALAGANADDIVKATKVKVDAYSKARKDKMLVENKLGPAIYMMHFIKQQKDAFYKGYLEFIQHCVQVIPKDKNLNVSDIEFYIMNIFTKMEDVYNKSSTAGYKIAYIEGYTASPDIFKKECKEFTLSGNVGVKFN